MATDQRITYTRTVEEVFYLKAGFTYRVRYAKAREVVGRFIARDEDTLIFRDPGPKGRLYSIRIKSLESIEEVR